MITEQIIKNGINVMKTHFPNLFIFLIEKDIEIFLRKSYTYTRGNGKANSNFMAHFLCLLKK